MNYYNSLVFRGYIEGIPTGVLSGGQYNKLMSKMGKKSKAVGFAVYLDLLERLNNQENEFDADVVVLYDNKTPPAQIFACVQEYVKSGKTVLALKNLPQNIRYMEKTDLTKGGGKNESC